MKFNEVIERAYKDTGRSDLWLACALQIEAAELADLIMKKHGYQKEYSDEELLSEAGDTINFLAALLWKHGYTLEDAMRNNEAKLKERGWI